MILASSKVNNNRNTESGLDWLGMHERGVGRVHRNRFQDGGVVVVVVSARRYKKAERALWKRRREISNKNPKIVQKSNSPTVQQSNQVPCQDSFPFSQPTSLPRTLSH